MNRFLGIKPISARRCALAIVLGAALPGRAQPPDPVPPQAPLKAPMPKYSPANLEAMALIGGFVFKMTHAKSYRGKLETSKINFQDDKEVGRITNAMSVSWMGASSKQGQVSKSAMELTFSTTSGAKTEVEMLKAVDDGTSAYRFYGSKNVWSQRTRSPDDTPFPMALARASWVVSLSFFNAGVDFATETKTVNGQKLIVVSVLPINKYLNQWVFDAKSGNLQSMTISAADQVSEFRWTETEFDVPLPDSIFEWKAPAGATQVAPGSATVNVQF